MFFLTQVQEVPVLISMGMACVRSAGCPPARFGCRLVTKLAFVVYVHCRTISAGSKVGDDIE